METKLEGYKMKFEIVNGTPKQKFNRVTQIVNQLKKFPKDKVEKFVVDGYTLYIWCTSSATFEIVRL